VRNSQGDSRVRPLLRQNALGMDLLGCDWHPPLHDDEILASTLTSFINSMSVSW
jgi:hypothetical protein